MDLELKNKSIIVTAAGSNIGRAITLGFAREGAKTPLADIDLEQANAVAAETFKRGAAATEVVQCDVTALVQVQAMFKHAVDRQGP